ncbi:hypothetical protein COX93_01430 [Candidatus Nomurabacteria bacterium CG_4_10_14_0_2_um_filter_30_12]|uniref:Uncharacterized protein n=3 Tax=Candidatus Nomuraibacteriota TaxID=1752729 RepID=A0A1J4V1N9_9BACT|nr:MAG: hypothetical protein AUJ22_00640 [Candidatus Nomurabacteria bacterium CG1_02_31_12]PIR68911.1 MAG: hypothetical protein COU48_01485 [Candidatus Nomurabacteria bacterium CG10_big_fil_rev_8_21_14_0_10_03_31_7]PIZ87313.1 MAG: hypothetical protein COX93_01430 [Candidatus Nomurabacteria bacterium CG_4_10_14_0_2_um_filter_30_12]
MNIKESYQPNNKPELGSFEVKKQGGVILRNIPFCEILANEKEYKESKERGKAISDLLKIWDHFFIAEVSNNVKGALKSPRGFKDFIESFSDFKDDNFDLKNFLEETLLEFELLENSFKTIEGEFLEDRLDFKDTDDMDLNDELKFKLESQLKWIDEKSKITEDLIKFLKLKITELL